jgi:hypothetical protein
MNYVNDAGLSLIMAELNQNTLADSAAMHRHL